MRPDSPAAAPLFDRGPSSTARLIILGLASILLMMADSRGHYLDRLRGALSTVVYPLQELASVPADTGNWLSEHFQSRAQLFEENRRLKQENLFLSGRLQVLKALQAENARLKALKKVAASWPERVMVAEIVQVDLATSSHQVLINRGTLDGAYPGQPVLDADGVMGQVVRAGPWSAFVMLISDPNSALPVQVNRSGLRSIAQGTGRADTLELNDVPLSADIAEGDLLVTSGLGGRFPTGLRVGRVSEVLRDPGLPFARVLVDPAAALKRSRHVLLIWPEAPVPAPEDSP